jgi:hypothetical protein
MLTWRGSCPIGGPHDWNVPDEVHRALRVRAAQHAFRYGQRQRRGWPPSPAMADWVVNSGTWDEARVAIGDHVDALHGRDRLRLQFEPPDDRAKRPGIRQNERQPQATVPRADITCRARCSGYPSRMSQATAQPPVGGRQGIARRTGQYWTVWSPTIENCA